MKIKLTIYSMFLMTISGVAFADVSLQAIAKIESSNRPDAIGDNGKAYGLYQTHIGVVMDYVRMTGNPVQHKDMFNPVIAEKVTRWYLDVQIPRMMKAMGIPDTLENRLGCYNAGCGNVKKGRTNPNYVRKYKEAVNANL